MHDVDGRLALAKGQLDGGLHGRFHVLERKRHGTRGVCHHINRAPALALQRLRNLRHIAQRGAHQQKLRLRQHEQGHLPSPPAIGLAIEMELVHRDAPDIGILAFAQRLISKNFLRAADDGRLRVDVHVARDHAHVLATKQVHQIEELLADQRFNGSGVIRGAPGAHGHEVHAQRHHGFARTGGRAQNHMVAGR